MFWRVAIIVVLGIFNVAVFGKMVWGPTGLVQYHELKNQYSRLQDRIAMLNAQNLALSKDIRLLQSDGQYVEKMVRQRLHYLRDNEVVYLFASPADNRNGASSDDGKN